MHRALAIAAVAAATLASGMVGLTARAQETQAQVPAVNQTATPVLWRDPGPIGEKDLFWGAGSAERRPEPPFTFVKEDLSGSKPKVRVTDARGRAWNVKFAGELKEKNEVNPEVAANRLIWALGYLVEEDYYVAEGTIQGVRGLQRASSSIRPDGTFRTARFERRDESIVRGDTNWTLAANPFTDSRELSGLLILLALVNNWDNKPENTAIDRATLDGGLVEDRYLFSDWGASFGRMAGPPWKPAPTRWQLQHFKEQPLTRGVEGDMVKIYFAGQVPIENIPVEHARWFAALAGQLRVEQVRRAFEAAGASATDADGFAARVIEKIEELRTALGTTAAFVR